MRLRWSSMGEGIEAARESVAHGAHGDSHDGAGLGPRVAFVVYEDNERLRLR
jgi:hypothetical protein